jgi:hypothetical protein
MRNVSLVPRPHEGGKGPGTYCTCMLALLTEIYTTGSKEYLEIVCQLPAPPFLITPRPQDLLRMPTMFSISRPETTIQALCKSIYFEVFCCTYNLQISVMLIKNTNPCAS